MRGPRWWTERSTVPPPTVRAPDPPNVVEFVVSGLTEGSEHTLVEVAPYRDAEHAELLRARRDELMGENHEIANRINPVTLSMPAGKSARFQDNMATIRYLNASIDQLLQD